MAYTLGDVDWRRFAYDYELEDVPFDGADPSLTHAEDELEIIFENGDTELYYEVQEGIGQDYTLAVYAEPGEDSDELRNTLRQWFHGRYEMSGDVDYIKSEYGVEPVELAKEKLCYINNPGIWMEIEFDGDGGILLAARNEARGNYGGGGDNDDAIFKDGRAFDFDEFARTHGGKYAGILEEVDDDWVMKKQMPTVDIEKYLKEA